MSHLALAQALRLEALRAVAALAGSLLDRLERTAPRAAPVLAWLRANRTDVAAIGCAVVGTLLIAAGGGLI